MPRHSSTYRANRPDWRMVRPDRRELPPAVAKALRRAVARRALHRWDGLAESPAAKVARGAMRGDRQRARVPA